VELNMSRPDGQRRMIRNYLLDRRVQLGITAVMVVLTSLLTAGLGMAWYAEVRNASAVIQVNAMSVLGADTANALAAELARNDQKRLLMLVSFGVALALLVIGYGIVTTHRIAGPLFKMKRYLSDIEQGRLSQLRGLRRGDQLQDFFLAFERMHHALRDRAEADIALLDQVAAQIDQGEDLRPLLPPIRASLQAKRQGLEAAG
jgi:methyl-accepting chemotaxis protein